jgi:hypothetical protein
VELIAELTPIVRDDDCSEWRPRVFAVEREDGTWAAWIQFRCGQSGESLLTSPIETTQADRDAVAYWATGLEDIYLQGALSRARRLAPGQSPADNAMRIVTRPVHLQQIDLYVLDFLHRAGAPRVETKSIFDDQIFANADLVRSFEYLEQRHGLIVRSTDGGRDWLELTELGCDCAKTASTTDECVENVAAQGA